MKNKMIAMVAAAALAASVSLVGCGGSQPAADSSSTETEQTQSDTSTKKDEATTTTEQPQATEQTEETAQAPITATEREITITADQAKEIALSNLGVTEEDVTNLSVEFDDDDDDPIRHYDVTFVNGGMEYNFEIDAADGSVNEVTIDTPDAD